MPELFMKLLFMVFINILSILTLSFYPSIFSKIR